MWRRKRNNFDAEEIFGHPSPPPETTPMGSLKGFRWEKGKTSMTMMLGAQVEVVDGTWIGCFAFSDFIRWRVLHFRLESAIIEFGQYSNQTHSFLGWLF